MIGGGGGELRRSGHGWKNLKRAGQEFRGSERRKSRWPHSLYLFLGLEWVILENIKTRYNDALYEYANLRYLHSH